jgi:hypothetical protein
LSNDFKPYSARVEGEISMQGVMLLQSKNQSTVSLVVGAEAEVTSGGLVEVGSGSSPLSTIVHLVFLRDFFLGWVWALVWEGCSRTPNWAAVVVQLEVIGFLIAAGQALRPE